MSCEPADGASKAPVPTFIATDYEFVAPDVDGLISPGSDYTIKVRAPTNPSYANLYRIQVVGMTQPSAVKLPLLHYLANDVMASAESDPQGNTSVYHFVVNLPAAAVGQDGVIHMSSRDTVASNWRFRRSQNVRFS